MAENPAFPPTEKIKFLLQVWNTDGKNIYERRLKRVPRFWGMFEDLFIYVEQAKELDSSGGLCVLKCFENKPAKLLLINIPHGFLGDPME